MAMENVERESTYMQPHNRTLNVAQPSMQAISIPQINRRHTRAPASIITAIIVLDLTTPQLAVLLGRVLPKPDVDEEVAVRKVGLEVGRWRG